jgi:carbon-monoxide dehydrogenase large subunit
MKFGIGQPARRVEDLNLITGRGRYTDDIRLPGMVHAFVVRSPLAHARIHAIDAAAARAMPGVLLVLTGEEVRADGLGDLTCLVPLWNRDGTPRRDTPRPILALGKVRHVGQPLALVVAETPEQARDAAEVVEVEYEELRAVVDARAAIEPGAPQLFDGVPRNIVFDWDNDTSDFAATEAAFARAARVTTLELVNNRVVVNAMEPRNAIGAYDEESNRSVLYSGTQGSHFVRDALAQSVLKVPKERVRVVTPPNVGGGFGMKAFLYPEQALVVWAATKLRRPVKWQSDRGEGFISDNHGRDHFTRADLAMDENGRFLGLRVSIIANTGAYLSQIGPFVHTRSTDLVSGLYTTPAIAINVKGVCTNTVPVCAYRGAGRPEASYVIERLVDAAARDMGLTPDAIRRINFIPRSRLPYVSATKLAIDSGEFEGMMDLAMQKADWAGFSARRADSEVRGMLRGIGMATYTERCGGGAAESGSIEFKDGRVALIMGNQELGTGLVTAYTQLVSDRLGIDADRIDVIMGDTDRCPCGLTAGSRALPVAGSALHEASLKIIDKGRRIAAHLLEAAPGDVEFERGMFRIGGTDRAIDILELAGLARDRARLPPGMEPGLDATHVQTPAAYTFPNGCHIAEVEIDPESGVVTVARYTVLDDFGSVINPLLLEGQVHGGVVQGIGQALHEHTVYDASSGQLLSGTLGDYKLPRAHELPSFSFSTRNVPCEANPLGVKGAGEAGAVGAPAAVMNAVTDALYCRTGIRLIDMPATPQRVWKALNGIG